jgi:hypothetical protein
LKCFSPHFHLKGLLKILAFCLSTCSQLLLHFLAFGSHCFFLDSFLFFSLLYSEFSNVSQIKCQEQKEHNCEGKKCFNLRQFLPVGIQGWFVYLTTKIQTRNLGLCLNWSHPQLR